MPRYKLTDPETGQVIYVRGDTPPSQDQVAELFAQAKQGGSEPMAERVGNAIASGAREFAHGANRTIAAGLDLPADVANAAMQDAGIDQRLPTVRGQFDQAGITQNVMEPGLARDILSSSGEALPAVMGGAQALRSVAGRLPAQTAGEAATTGVLRDLGRSTPAQDAAAGVLAAGGAEIGEEVGGPVGAQLGAIAAPLAGGSLYAGGRALAENAMTSRAVTEAAPTSGMLKSKYRGLLKEVDDAGEVIGQDDFAGLANKITEVIKRDGFNPRLQPKTAAALDELATASEGPITLTQLDVLRRVASAAARDIDAQGKATPDGALGGKIVGMIDSYIDTLPSRTSGKSADMLKRARKAWGQARKVDMMETALEKASLQASGFENGIRIQMRSILNNKKKSRAFDKDELALMRKVVKGGPAENIAKLLGKFGMTEGQATSALLSFGGATAGYAAAGTPGAIAMLTMGQMAKRTAQQLTRRNARLANDLIRAGKDGRKIATAYLRNTPKGERNVEELTALLLRDGVTLPKVKGTSKLVSDSAYFAAILREGLKDSTENTEQTTNQ